MMYRSRVTYKGPVASLSGRSGKFIRYYGSTATKAVVSFDGEPNRERIVDISNLTPEETTIMSNFKTLVSAAVATLLAVIKTDSPKEAAIRKLGVAAELVRLGEAAKVKAKKELTALGLITGEPQTGVVFDSARYIMTATTKAASSRLDSAKLEQSMIAEGISGAMRRRILDAATVENKAPVSFTVEAR